MRREDYEDSPIGQGMEAIEAIDAIELSPAFEARTESGKCFQTGRMVVLAISVLLLASGCMVLRQYWLEWPSESACQPDWGQCPIPWVGPMMAPLGLIACVVGTGVEALRGRSCLRWLAAEVALVGLMVATLSLDHWLSGLR